MNIRICVLHEDAKIIVASQGIQEQSQQFTYSAFKKQEEAMLLFYFIVSAQQGQFCF